MTLYEFKLLPEQEQYRVIFNEGDFITYRLKSKARFALYALDKFFVEVEYNPRGNKIEMGENWSCTLSLNYNTKT